MADNTYRSGEHLIQTAQTQCDCANTMRLRKHNATTQTQCDYANTMRLRKHNATTQTQKQSVRNFLLLSMLVCMPIS